MSYKDPKNPQITSPVLLDNAIQQIQNKMATLSWISDAFGRARKAVEERDGRRFTSPEAYEGDGEYISLLPNDNLDCYCFFDVDDPQTIGDYEGEGSFANIEASVSLVVYGNLERIDSSKTYYFSEELKKDVLDLLHRGLTSSSPTVIVESIYEDIENVFRGYSIEDVKTQLFKHPWFGMRFECKLIFREKC